MKPIKNTMGVKGIYVWTHPSALVLKHPNGDWVRLGERVEVEDFHPCNLMGKISNCPGCVRVVGQTHFQCVAFGSAHSYALKKFEEGGQ